MTKDILEWFFHFVVIYRSTRSFFTVNIINFDNYLIYIKKSQVLLMLWSVLKSLLVLGLRYVARIREIGMKHWNLLHVNPNLAKILHNSPILAFRWNRNLKDIGTKLIESGKVRRKFTNKIQGKCTPCLAINNPVL